MTASTRWTHVRHLAAAVCCTLAAIALGYAFMTPAVSASGAPAAVSAADKAAANTQFDKAKALYDQKKYAEAQVENEKALKLDPANVNAVLLQGLLKNVLASVGGGGGTSSAPAVVTPQGKIPLLTPQQINIIRLVEVSTADTRLVGRIDAKVLEDFWQNVIVKERPTSTKAEHDAFVNAGNFAGQARRIRESRDPKYMEQVNLTSDPVSFRNYSGAVQTFVLQNCATAECHSERGQAGNFRLLNPAASPEQQYTNFYILNQYANADGKMIDRASPEKSLLVQYGLPWANASAKHPKVDVRKFSGLTDSRLRSTLDWINSLGMTKPDYNINYPVPGASIAPAKN